MDHAFLAYLQISVDLWGRGYSDAPLSGSHALPQSSRLFTTSVLLALTSSTLPWTGSTSFSLIGYSLGGGIAANFTSFFPNMVSSVVLIAPSGLQRPHNITWTSKLLYSTRWFPESWLQYLVKRRLSGNNPTEKPTTPDGPEAAEVPMQERPGSFDRAVLSRSRPGVTVASVVVSLTILENRHRNPKLIRSLGLANQLAPRVHQVIHVQHPPRPYL